MFIKSVHVQNYKSFRDSGRIEFDEGVNLIVGVNNSGKTALLEALSQTFQHKIHVGDSGYSSPESRISFTLRIKSDEIRKELDVSGQIIMPTLSTNGVMSRLLQEGLSSHFDIHLDLAPSNPVSRITYPDGDELYDPISNGFTQFNVSQGNVSLTSESGGSTQHFTERKLRDFVSRFFFFSGERMKLHTAQLDQDPLDLKSDASNLADLLHRKQAANAAAYKENYIRLINRVLPNVKHVSAVLLGNAQATLRVWPKEQTPSGANISHLLSESGTGIGQVLAIVYVIAYLEPSVIIIDEPNSFLHPAATRELLRIFKENSHHQYFISTHSPEVFAELKPANYTTLTYRDGETVQNRSSFGDLGDTYRDLGISPFFERALWVEGETEVLTFPKILRDAGMQFFKVNSAAELGVRFNKKHELDRLINLHKDMVTARNGEPIPSTMRIIVDSEHLRPKSIEDYQRRPDRIIHFLSRKMFENYLLDAEAIAAVLSDLDGRDVSVESVQEFLHLNRGNKDEVEWLRNTHAANLLIQLFRELTEARCEFQKTTHSVALTNHLLATNPHHFDELKISIQQAFVEAAPENIA